MKKIKPIASNINAVTINFRREKLNQIIKIRVNPKVAEVFKSTDTRDSSDWIDDKGAIIKYYALSDGLNSLIRAYSNATGKFATVTDYGSSSIDGNYSILRSVDIENGIVWKYNQSILNDEQVKVWITELADFTKWVYINYIQIYQVKAVIKFNF